MKKNKLHIHFLLLLIAIVCLLGFRKSEPPCPYYYEGKKCDTLVRQKFIGEYTGNATTSVNGSPISITGTQKITAGADSLSQLGITLSIGVVSFSAIGVVTGKYTFDIPLQIVNGGNFSGRGRLLGIQLFDTINIGGNNALYYSGSKN